MTFESKLRGTSVKTDTCTLSLRDCRPCQAAAALTATAHEQSPVTALLMEKRLYNEAV